MSGDTFSSTRNIGSNEDTKYPRQKYSKKTVKILHINLDNFLSPLIKKCRSILIVGGTLHPVNLDYIGMIEFS